MTIKLGSRKIHARSLVLHCSKYRNVRRQIYFECAAHKLLQETVEKMDVTRGCEILKLMRM